MDGSLCLPKQKAALNLRCYRLSRHPDGAIWTFVNGAAVVFDGKHWQDGGVLGGIPREGGVKALFFDRQGTQWISTARSVYFRPHDQRRFQATGITYQRGQDTSNFVEMANGDLWLAVLYTSPSSGSDLRKLDVPSHRTNTPKSIEVPAMIDEVFVATDGSLWLTGSDIYRFSDGLTQPTTSPVPEVFGVEQGLRRRKNNHCFRGRPRRCLVSDHRWTGSASNGRSWFAMWIGPLIAGISVLLATPQERFGSAVPAHRYSL